ncbi:putative sodium/metabolite cotransporter BASS3 chloroplastic [Bienertia sinuspersici]
MALSSPSLSTTIPIISSFFLQQKLQPTSNFLSFSSNSPLNCSNSCLRLKRKAIYGCKISGYLKNLPINGDYDGIADSNDKLSVSMCSTTPFIEFGGRVGLQRREGNVSLLSFGVDSNNQSCVDDSKSGGSSQILSAMLPFVVVATAVAALSQPSTFTWVSKDLYAPALGFVLTACVAGAQLSSYASFLSKGDVALSILLTSSSTIASVIITPLLTRLLIGSVVPVDAVSMSKSILQVVLVPISLGLLLNTYAKAVVNLLQPVMPVVAMVCTSLCIGSPLAINRGQILSADGLRLIAPVLAFHGAAFALGYWLSKLPISRQKEDVSRTISLCTGMQSSTLAGLLATQFLGSSQAVPSACSVVAMAIMGLSLASFWGNGLRIRDLQAIAIPCFKSKIKAS